ncbi:MAG: IclR family transcriptional regulator [Rhodobacteraceae bacterium]|nr:IclR family transcriptional regulator [Paracoccaceae bacterium]
MSVDTPLSRYVRLLEAIAGAPGGMTLTELAAAAGLLPASTHRLVAGLRETGLLSRAEGSRTYHAGPRLRRLAQLAAGPPTLADLAGPELDELVGLHAETAFLARLEGDGVTSVAMATPTGGERAFVQPGRVMPFHASTSARAIFAFQPAEVVERMLALPLPRLTLHTRTDPEAIRRDLAEVRARGIAEGDSELDPGVMSYAVPVFGPDGSVRHALGICGLSTSLRAAAPQGIRDSLRRCSRTLAAKLAAAAGPG